MKRLLHQAPFPVWGCEFGPASRVNGLAPAASPPLTRPDSRREGKRGWGWLRAALRARLRATRSPGTARGGRALGFQPPDRRPDPPRRGRRSATSAARSSSPVVRLGVTGLSRAGKTVFITSLVANLHRPRPHAAAARRRRGPHPRRLPAAAARPHHPALRLRGPPRRADRRPSRAGPRAPARSRRCACRSGSRRPACSPASTGPRTVHLDIVDYPGEWLLDLPLMNQSFEDWSAAAIATARAPARAAQAARLARRARGRRPRRARSTRPPPAASRPPSPPISPPPRAAGLSSVAPGRFLMPGDLEGSPALTFSPLPKPARRPSALALARLRAALRGLQARGGRAVLPQPLRPARPPGGADRRARRHPRRPARGRGPARGDGRDPRLLPPGPALLARADPRPAHRPHPLRRDQGRLPAPHAARPPRRDRRGAGQGRPRPRASSAAPRPGRSRSPACAPPSSRPSPATAARSTWCAAGSIDTGEEVALFPGDLPEDPAAILAPARQGARRLDRRRLPRHPLRAAAAAAGAGDGLPHIRLDRAAEFLIGDRLR